MTTGGPVARKRGKCPVAAVPGTGAIGRHSPEMIGGPRTQAIDVHTDTLVGIPSLGPGGSGRAVAGRGPILEVNSCGQSVRINRPVQRS